MNRKNQEGIAIVVVVAIMVALIMVTTALLGVVTRVGDSSKIYFNKDLARLAALSGKAYAINLLRSALATNSTVTTLNPATYAVATSPLSVNSDGVFPSAYCLSPVFNLGIYGRSYGQQCAVMLPFEAAQSLGNAFARITATAAGETLDSSRVFYVTGTSVSSPPTYTVSNANTISAREYGQFSSVGDYFKYVDNSYFDKDMALPWDPTSPSAPTTDSGKLAVSFYASRYAVCIQDLGGCLNLDYNAANNNYDPAQVKILYNMMGGVDNSPDNVEDVLTKIKAGTVDEPKSFDDMQVVLGDSSSSNNLQRLNFTPWGKIDTTNGTPLCINVYTASSKLIYAMVKNVVQNCGLRVERVAVPTATPPVTAIGPVTVSTELNETGTNEIQLIASQIENSRAAGKSVTDIADDIVALSTLTANQKLAASAVAYCLFGKVTDVDGSSAIDVADRDMFIITSTSAAITAAWLDSQKFGRLVASGSSGLAAPNDAAGANGPGPYFRVRVRGVLMNLAKSEITSQANLEFVYNNSTNEIVFQKWYENE